MTGIPARLVSLLLFLAPLSARAETLTLDQCVGIALKSSPDTAVANLEVEAALAKKDSARGGYSPRLKLDAGFQRWDKAMNIPLFSSLKQFCENCTWKPAVDPSTLPAGTSPPLLIDMPMPLRPQWTWSVGVTLAQPIGALWTIHEANELARLGIDVAEIKRKAARRDVAYQVTEAYYRVLQARRMADIAQKSVEQIAAQVQRARTFFARGVVARNDVLRAELGQAAATQRLIQAKGAVTLATGRLATLMGRSPDSDIVPVDIGDEPASQVPIPAAQAEQQAVNARFELKELAATIDMAEGGVRLSKSKMIPQVNAIANYTRQTQSLLGLPQSWFVGATASWDLWEGGSTYYGIDESKARLAQAQSARRKAEDMIRLDARSAHVAVTTAREALDVARSAVASAEENFRMEQKRYESTSSTSFDVLDAETQLTSARGQHQAAIYELLIAESNLARAMGEIHPAVKAAP
jgi:outer membrane protein